MNDLVKAQVIHELTNAVGGHAIRCWVCGSVKIDIGDVVIAIADKLTLISLRCMRCNLHSFLASSVDLHDSESVQGDSPNIGERADFKV